MPGRITEKQTISVSKNTRSFISSSLRALIICQVSGVSLIKLGCRNVLLGVYGFFHRRALHHALLPCRVGAELRHGELTAQAPAVKNQRVGIDERVLAAQDPLFSLEHGVDLLAIGPERFTSVFFYADRKSVV